MARATASLTVPGAPAARPPDGGARSGPGSLRAVPTVLLATDADWIRDEVEAALADADTSVSRVRRGVDVLPAVQALDPDLVVLDLQIGSMGGLATAYDLRLEEGALRIDPVKILLLLDRADDRFLARTASVDGWLVKPVDGFRLRRAARAVLDGEGWFEQASGVPVPDEPAPSRTAQVGGSST